MTKWLITYSCKKDSVKWRFVEFGGKTGAESYGIVDMIAIRKDHRRGLTLRRGDRLEIVLIQVKGGTAGLPTSEDVDRLRKVKNHHRAKAVVLAEWKLARTLALRRLVRRKWVPMANAAEVFG